MRIFLPLLLVLQIASAGAQTAPEGDVTYLVKRNGEKIGTMQMNFRREGDRLTVRSDYEIQIRLMSIVLYRYEKHMTETYENGELTAYAADIDDNGELSSVRAARDGDGLSITHPDGSLTAPAGLYPSTYWPPATVRQTTLIDSSDGILVNVTVSAPVPEELAIDGRTVRAERYRMRGDLERDLWYAAEDGAWLKMRMTADDGSTIEIERDWPPVWKRGLL